MHRPIGLLLPFVIVVAVGPPVAAEERPLSGSEIVETLSGNTAIGDDGDWKQFFDANGETPYVVDDEEVDLGKWKVEGDTYLSWWESTGWTSYTMTGAGDHITWISEDGEQQYPATMVQGNQLD